LSGGPFIVYTRRVQPQMQRALALDRWLRARRRITAKQAAADLGVDERTIRRDLKQVLGGEWNLPVRYDRSRREWYYDGEAAPLPATVVSESDRFALLLSLQSAEQYRGTPVYDRLRRVYRRLLDLMPPETRTSFESLAAKVRFEGPPTPVVPEGIWDRLFNALDDGTTLDLVYRTGRDGEVRRRRVDPYGLVVRHRDWFLVGWDHLRQAVRTFYVPRVRSAEDTEDRFRVRDGFDLDRYLSTAVDGHQSTGPVYRVKLRFAKEAAAVGEAYAWNATQTVTTDAEGRVVVEFDTGALYAVEREVLGWGGRVEVLEPQALRQQVEQAVEVLHRAFGARRN
jgi:predicted DNA-binding transcriptional regulator YafY